MLYVNIGKVRAYQLINSFKKGDMITTLVSCKENDKHETECETEKFAVIRDNVTDNKNDDAGYIYAIYNSYIGEPVKFSDLNNTLTTLTKESKEKYIFSFTEELLKIDDIVDNFDGKETEITDATWAKSDFPYWVEDESGGKYYVEGSKIKVADENTKAYIRPIIRSLASRTKNGVIKPSSWKEFNEMLKTIFEDEKDITYEYNNTSLILKKDESYFKYSFDGATLKFDSGSQDKSDIIPEFVLEILSYDLLTDSHELRMIDDKIIGEYFTLDFKNPETFSINLAYYFGWEKIDIANSDAVQTSEIKNPKTGDKKLNFVICISVLLTGVLIYSVRKLKKLN